MSTFIVRVVDSSGGRLRGVAERVADRHEYPFTDQQQLLDVLSTPPTAEPTDSARMPGQRGAW